MCREKNGRVKVVVEKILKQCFPHLEISRKRKRPTPDSAEQEHPQKDVQRRRNRTVCNLDVVPPTQERATKTGTNKKARLNRKGAQGKVKGVMAGGGGGGSEPGVDDGADEGGAQGKVTGVTADGRGGELRVDGSEYDTDDQEVISIASDDDDDKNFEFLVGEQGSKEQEEQGNTEEAEDTSGGKGSTEKKEQGSTEEAEDTSGGKGEEGEIQPGVGVHDECDEANYVKKLEMKIVALQKKVDLLSSSAGSSSRPLQGSKQNSCSVSQAHETIYVANGKSPVLRDSFFFFSCVSELPVDLHFRISGKPALSAVPVRQRKAINYGIRHEPTTDECSRFPRFFGQGGEGMTVSAKLASSCVYHTGLHVWLINRGSGLSAETKGRLVLCTLALLWYQ